MRTEQDKINRKEANQRYYNLEENKEQKREYMKAYYKRGYVIGKRKKRYLHHEQWAQDNGYRNDDLLNTKNTISFKDDS
jgi:hypothetical protein